MPRRKAEPVRPIRELIRERVAALGLTPTTLADRCGGAVSRPMLSQYLAGRNDLSGARLDAVLAAVGLRVVVAE
jgi:transcriptional regulator with XRE-family HTH domain